MQVLLVGAGGREHALARKLVASPTVTRLVVAGNWTAGRFDPKLTIGETATTTDALVALAQRHEVDLVVVGPEQPLVDGLHDALRKVGIYCFGPSKRAAQMEGSKAYMKDFASRHGVPTAAYKVFRHHDEAAAYVRGLSHRVVIKASGLAAGKGVLVPETTAEALDGLDAIMNKRIFGAAGDEVVVEQFLEGEELSVLALTDGYTIVPLPAAQDHKRVADNDQGPNTGGMGAYAPAPLATPALLEKIVRTILKPTVDGLRRDGTPYVGVLYAGLMISPAGEPWLLEYNCRFGDPETQVIVPLLADDCDLAQVMLACCEGRLDAVPVTVRSGYAATVVAASAGYPNAYPTGLPITIGADAQSAHRVLYLAGTKSVAGDAVGDHTTAARTTTGGRVLAVTGLGATLEAAVAEAYAGIRAISFEGMHYRRDIGHRALARLAAASVHQVTYAQAGVDVDAGDSFVERIKPLAKSTARTGCDSELGGFGGLFDLAQAGYKDPVLCSGTDGVGTKLRIALSTGIHNTVGIDLVAMSVNDLVVQGAEPLFFLDYYATSHLDIETAVKVLEGVAAGCRESGCALLGGETAEMPGMYHPGDYDLAGFAVGVVERHQILPKACQVGDVILGLPSSGVHSNGYSLVRHLVSMHGFDYGGPVPFTPTNPAHTTLAQALLAPTRLYVKTCIPLAKRDLLVAMAHITGGGLRDNIPRFLAADLAVALDATTWPFLPVFQWLARLGNMSSFEIGRTFNCGIGMVLAVRPENVAAVEASLAAIGETVYRIGAVVPRPSPDAPQVRIDNTDRAWPQPRV